MPIDDYLVRSGAKELLSRAVAEILTLRPRVPVHALANHFQAVVFGQSIATAAKSLRASHPSKRAFPDVALRVFCELADGQYPSPAVSTAPVGASSTKPKAASATNVKATSAAAPGSASSTARTISSTMLEELLRFLTSEFSKVIQTRALQRLLRPAASTPGSSTDNMSEPVDFDTFVRAVDACLLLEELLDAASELFRLLQAQQQQSEAFPAPIDSAAMAVSLSLAGQLDSALQSAASQFPQRHELLRALLSPPTDGSYAPTLFSTVINASDVQEALVRLVLGEDDPM